VLPRRAPAAKRRRRLGERRTRPVRAGGATRYEQPFAPGRRRGISAFVKPARRHATYQDLDEVPEPLVAELIDGDLYTSPRPAIRHARVASALAQDLRSFDEPPGRPGAPGGWWILYLPVAYAAQPERVKWLASGLARGV
jgi:hypothetical protein